MDTYEDYTLMEATENDLEVRKHRDGQFSVHTQKGSRLFEDRDIERVRAYLMGFSDGLTTSPSQC
ncbi:hypothetical protein Pan97_14590 [Bremerella volcania]|uniref:Uncharacterized protein n=1 Tax=Bremerella volcania TaxID=2527984 RepID=A0A518C5H1_9BACT|nr:hypothetical protein [Bremerella volcania]QDU74451.1 hypothetical protein Pan97_14590 [Bremerella volcania]